MIRKHLEIKPTLADRQFVAIPRHECPCTDDDNSGCNLDECSYNMSPNDLCEADDPLPDGNANYDINNCPLTKEVFRCVLGKCSPTQKIKQYINKLF